MYTADFITDWGYVRRAIFACDHADAYKQATNLAAFRGEQFQFASIREVEGDFQQVVHSHWVAQDDTFTRFACARCGSRNWHGYERHCPSCGVPMHLSGQR